jgi:hypothetical protein
MVYRDLAQISAELEQHFDSLKVRRQGQPIYALEHDLGAEAIAEVATFLRATVASNKLTTQHWLPLVVYATEVGYRYEGEEYWQTFASETPGWSVFGDRALVRSAFQRFAASFGGALPAGAWAEWFTIISWPITHAVLPTDLQTQLARLLFELRYSLTSEVRTNPIALGNLIASRAHGGSKRFQKFAENRALLGLVAAALLLGEHETSELLLRSTLTRIVADLEKHRQARQWLRDARRGANDLRIRGLRRPSRGIPSGIRSPKERLSGARLPNLMVQRGPNGSLRVALALPDLTDLLQIYPGLEEALQSCRCRVAGSEGPPLARGQLLYPEQQRVLEAWPARGVALLELENGTEAINHVLAEECALSPGPTWVFGNVERDVVKEVRGKTVRPGRSYLLLATSPIDPSLIGLRATEVACAGVYAYTLDVPARVDDDGAAQLTALGLTVVRDLDLMPIGPAPAEWDGEGGAEFLVGDEPLIRISSSLDVDTFELSLNGGPAASVHVGQAEGGRRVGYATIRDLDVGRNEMRVVVRPRAGGGRVVEGSLTMSVREAAASSELGSSRYPMLLMVLPYGASLSELWQGDATVSVLGPPGAGVKLRVSLEGNKGRTLVERQIGALTLPISSQTWRRAFDQGFREVDQVSRYVDEAAACIIQVSHPDFGLAVQRAEREFSPLRWAVGSDHNGDFARLVDNLEAADPVVTSYSFRRPDVGVAVQLDKQNTYRSGTGGLLIAQEAQCQTSIVLAPTVRRLTELGALRQPPALATKPRSAQALVDWMSVSRLWASAQLPGNVLAYHQRDATLRWLAITVASSIGGPNWGTFERRVEDEQPETVSELNRLVSLAGVSSLVDDGLRRRATALAEGGVGPRIDALARVLKDIHARREVMSNADWLASFVLRLASRPDTALGWAGDGVTRALTLALEFPVLVRTARFLVLACHRTSLDTATSFPYRGFPWF